MDVAELFRSLYDYVEKKDWLKAAEVLSKLNAEMAEKLRTYFKSRGVDFDEFIYSIIRNALISGLDPEKALEVVKRLAPSKIGDISNDVGVILYNKAVEHANKGEYEEAMKLVRELKKLLLSITDRDLRSRIEKLSSYVEAMSDPDIRNFRSYVNSGRWVEAFEALKRIESRGKLDLLKKFLTALGLDADRVISVVKYNYLASVVDSVKSVDELIKLINKTIGTIPEEIKKDIEGARLLDELLKKYRQHDFEGMVSLVEGIRDEELRKEVGALALWMLIKTLGELPEDERYKALKAIEKLKKYGKVVNIKIPDLVGMALALIRNAEKIAESMALRLRRVAVEDIISEIVGAIKARNFDKARETLEKYYPVLSKVNIAGKPISEYLKALIEYEEKDLPGKLRVLSERFASIMELYNRYLQSREKEEFPITPELCDELQALIDYIRKNFDIIRDVYTFAAMGGQRAIGRISLERAADELWRALNEMEAYLAYFRGMYYMTNKRYDEAAKWFKYIVNKSEFVADPKLKDLVAGANEMLVLCRVLPKVSEMPVEEIECMLSVFGFPVGGGGRAVR